MHNSLLNTEYLASFPGCRVCLFIRTSIIRIPFGNNRNSGVLSFVKKLSLSVVKKLSLSVVKRGVSLLQRVHYQRFYCIA